MSRTVKTVAAPVIIGRPLFFDCASFSGHDSGKFVVIAANERILPLFQPAGLTWYNIVLREVWGVQ
jgi:hypothetical protein